MKSTQIVYILFAIVAILGWNAFLIQRDKKMIESYIQHQTIKQQNDGLNI